MSELKLKGQITISKVSSNKEDDYIRIAVVDEDAGIEFCTIKMSLKDFADTITGRGHAKCDLGVRGLDKVGMKAENKVENVKRMHSQSEKDAVAPYEVDGWFSRKGDAENHHNVTEHNPKEGYNVYRVVFYRWVEKDESDNENNRVDT